MTAPADSRISDERLVELLTGLDDAAPNEELGGFVGRGDWVPCGEVQEVRALITELRKRRAQAVTVKPLEWLGQRKDAWPSKDGRYVIRLSRSRYAVYRQGPASPEHFYMERSEVETTSNTIKVSEWNSLESAQKAAQTDHERRILSALAAPPPAQAVAVKPEMEAQHRPEWIWYSETTSGVPLVTFGRWPKHPQQARYKLAEIQPTEHDHSPPSQAADPAIAALADPQIGDPPSTTEHE